MSRTTVSATGPRPAHPLHGARRRGVPVVVVILIGWLARLGWSAEQIVPVLAVLAPTAAASAGRQS